MKKISNVFKWLFLYLCLLSICVRKDIVINETKVESNINFNTIEEFIKENNYHVSIGYLNIKSGFVYKYNEDEIYYGASLIKTLDALYVYENMDVTFNLKKLVKPTIMVSNNSTHKALVNIIGFNNLKEYGKKIGAIHTLQGTDYYGFTTVDDELIKLKRLYDYINNEENKYRRELKNYFINDHYNYLNFLDSPIVLHKYGYYDIYFHDVGIVLDKNPYLIVILTKEGKNDFTIITEIAKKINKIHNFLSLGKKILDIKKDENVENFFIFLYPK